MSGDPPAPSCPRASPPPLPPSTPKCGPPAAGAPPAALPPVGIPSLSDCPRATWNRWASGHPRTLPGRVSRPRWVPGHRRALLLPGYQGPGGSQATAEPSFCRISGPRWVPRPPQSPPLLPGIRAHGGSQATPEPSPGRYHGSGGSQATSEPSLGGVQPEQVVSQATPGPCLGRATQSTWV